MSFLQSLGIRKSPRNSPKGRSRFSLKGETKSSDASPRVVENGADSADLQQPQVDIALAKQLVQAKLSSDSDSSTEQEERDTVPAIGLQLPSPEKQPASAKLCSDKSPAEKLTISKSADSLNGSGYSPSHAPFSPVRPSSPLLSVLREAVESLSSIEDFEKMEMIGSGFFAEVFKVSVMERVIANTMLVTLHAAVLCMLQYCAC